MASERRGACPAPWILIGVAAYVEAPVRDLSDPWYWIFIASGFGFLRRLFFGYNYPDGIGKKEG